MYYLGINNPTETRRYRKIYDFPTYMNPKKYNYVNRYGNTRRIVSEDGTIFYETVSNYKITESNEDSYITVENMPRLDIISYNMYGNSSYWWMIAMANNILDAFEEIPNGTVLRIPNIASVYSDGNVLSVAKK